MVAYGEYPTGERHKNGARNQQRFTAEAIGHRSNDQRHHRAAGKRGGEDPAYRREAQPDIVEIDSQNDGQKFVREGAHGTARHEQPAIAA
jgi:hypothetical protein